MKILIIILCLSFLLFGCQPERVYSSNSIERTSTNFQGNKHEAVYNIIHSYLRENPHIVHSRIKYPGNSVGHLFSVDTPESEETTRKTIFKVVDNQKSEYAIDRGIELTVFRGDTEYTIKEMFLDYTNSGMKIMNEDFHIIMNY